MHIAIDAEHLMPASPEAAFALSLDAQRFPALFRGFGPIPAVERITLHAPPAVGSTRELENSDGSRLGERITALEPARRHAYSLTGMRPPFGWLVRQGEADWRFTPHADGVRVAWSYRFTLTRPIAWPVAWPLLQGCMRTAMRRCLHAMDAMLRADAASVGPVR
jgi:hypothetical protein